MQAYLGFSPADNEDEAALVDKIEVGIVRCLVDAAAMLEGRRKFVTPRRKDFDLELEADRTFRRFGGSSPPKGP